MIYDQPFPGETPLIFEYFCIYRDSGPTRNLRSLCEAEVQGRKRNLRQITNWSAEHSWVERVEAFDIDIAIATAAATHQKRVDAHAQFTTADLEIACKIQADFQAFLTGEKPFDPERLQAYNHWIEMYSAVREWINTITIQDTTEKPTTNVKELLAALSCATDKALPPG